MSQAIAAVPFSYDGLDKDQKGKLISLSAIIKRHKNTIVESGLELGQAIASAHAILAGSGREGRFKEWVEAETDMDIRTAYNCKYLFEANNKHEIFSSLSPSVGYLLAAPTTPESAIKAAEKAVNRGEKISVQRAKEIIKEHRPEKQGSHKSNGKANSKPDPAHPPEPEGETPCPRGFDHEYDEGGVCSNCHDDPLPVLKPDKAFAKANELFGKLLRAISDCKDVSLHKLHGDVVGSLRVAYEDFGKWRKSAGK